MPPSDTLAWIRLAGKQTRSNTSENETRGKTGGFGTDVDDAADGDGEDVGSEGVAGAGDAERGDRKSVV